MSLHFAPAPPPALDSVLSALKSPVATRETRTLRDAEGRLIPVHPHPVHVLNDTTAPARHALGLTHRTGWRFLVLDDDLPVASAEACHTPDGWVFSHFAEGPFVASTLRALRQAQALPALYEPRLLSVPGLYMLALWLHTDSAPGNADDVLIPLAPAPPGFAAHRPHHATDLLSALTLRLTPAPLLTTTG